MFDLNNFVSGICSAPLRSVNNRIFFFSSPAFPLLTLSCFLSILRFVGPRKTFVLAFSSHVAVIFIRPLSEKKNPKTCKKLYYFDITSGVTVVGLGLIVIFV